MSDLIRRKDLCDFISAAYYDDRFNDPVVLLDELFERAKHFPAVDAVDVVRCSQCVNNPRIGTRTKGMVWCRKFRSEVSPGGFCSYGERNK